MKCENVKCDGEKVKDTMEIKESWDEDRVKFYGVRETSSSERCLLSEM